MLVYQETVFKTFIIASLVIEKKKTNPEKFINRKVENELCYVLTMKYYAVAKINELRSLAST